MYKQAKKLKTDVKSYKGLKVEFIKQDLKVTNNKGLKGKCY